MGKVKISKGHVLHGKDDRVEHVEIILNGGVSITDRGDITIQANQGAILGALHQAGEAYHYDYIASEDSTLFVYDYSCEEDLIAAMKASAAILPVMASANMALLNRFIDTLFALHKSGCALCTKRKTEYADYRDICAKLMVSPEQYDSIESLVLPEAPGLASSWKTDLCRAYLAQDELLRQEYYSVDSNFCMGCIMQAAEIMQITQQQIEQAAAYIQDTKTSTDAFTREYYIKKATLENANRKEAMEAGSSNLLSIEHALDTILSFAGVEREQGEAFRRDIQKFMQVPNQREKSAEMRHLRKAIADSFYAIYEAAFYKSQETADIPAEVRMLFLFGFVDEELAGAANTAVLYKYALLWEDDPSGRVLSLYDWLCKIYRGETLPSKSELDNDWPEYLKEQVRVAAMTQEKADSLLDDRKAMVHFELSNMVSSANAMTHGSIYSFVPAFYAGTVIKPLDSCFASPKTVHGVIDKLREIDFGCFYRPAFASYPELKINRFDYDLEILPYVILMPNFGSRGALWQEIEGRRRSTPGRMVLSIFHAADLDETIVKMCAQFRWEMCRRVQGIHYSDITDPSLTAEYGDYLQFYRKNRKLSADKKDSLKQVLHTKRNNYKNVFVADYEMYIKNEAFGLPRLNKVARDILFRYCTFSEKYRDALAANAQFQPIIERWSMKQAAKRHAFDIQMRNILTMTAELPEEVKIEADFMNK